MTITADDVADWIAAGSGAITLSEDETTLLERVVGAVTAHIARTHTAPDEDDDQDDWDQAHLMQAARIWLRKDTPNGIGGVGEFGAVRITKLDPDVASFLAPFKTIVFS